MKILPRTETPDLALETVRGATWRLSDETPDKFTMLVFYRGHHCPLCKKQLQELERLLPKFEEIGIKLVAISSNSRELADATVREWELEKLPVAYGLPLDTAREWGLFVSNAVKDTEPTQFSEPGIFVIAPDRTLYASMIQTMPFSRPKGAQILSSLEFIVEKGYPPRGDAG